MRTDAPLRRLHPEAEDVLALVRHDELEADGLLHVTDREPEPTREVEAVANERFVATTGLLPDRLQAPGIGGAGGQGDGEGQNGEKRTLRRRSRLIADCASGAGMTAIRPSPVRADGSSFLVTVQSEDGEDPVS